MKKIYYALFAAIVFLIPSAFAATQVIEVDGNGYSNTWDDKGCTNQWECVEDTSTTSKIYGYTFTQPYWPFFKIYRVSAFTLENFTATHNNITSLRYCFTGQRYSSSYYNVDFGFRIDGYTYYEYTWTLGSTYSTNCLVFSENPATDEAWTQEDINSLQFVARTSATNGGGMITHMNGVVVYD